MIRLELNRGSEGLELIVADDGIGIPGSIDPHTSNSFGIQINTNMIEMQLAATFEVDCRHGTEYRIKLPQL